jgi:hypothetical protein
MRKMLGSSCVTTTNVIEPDHVLQHGALPAPRSARQHQHLAALHIKAHILKNRLAAIGRTELLDVDDRSIVGL